MSCHCELHFALSCFPIFSYFDRPNRFVFSCYLLSWDFDFTLFLFLICFSLLYLCISLLRESKNVHRGFFSQVERLHGKVGTEGSGRWRWLLRWWKLQVEERNQWNVSVLFDVSPFNCALMCLNHCLPFTTTATLLLLMSCFSLEYIVSCSYAIYYLFSSFSL